MANVSLHIGLNSLAPEYQNNYDPLKAPENDAIDMMIVARKSGFTYRSILLTAVATYQNVVREIQTASKLVTKDDTFLLTFSGHGTLTRTDDLNENGYDANWCLFDNMMRDDELRILLDCFNAKRIIIISDSCNSGSMLDKGQIKSIRPKPASHIQEMYFKTHDNIVADIKLNSKPRLNNDSSVSGNKILLISASGNNSKPALDATSYDSRNSVFTEAILKVWDDNKFMGGYHDLYNRVEDMVEPFNMEPIFLSDPVDNRAEWNLFKPFSNIIIHQS